MELITSHIDKIEDLLAKMDETIDSSRAVPFSAKISIEKEALFSVIDDIRAIVYDMRKGMPTEIREAITVIRNKDAHISEARSKAEMIIKAAENEARKMLNEHEITMTAKAFAAEITADAKQEVEDFKVSAAGYVEGIFNDLDDLLRTTLDDHTRKAREVEDFYNNILSELYHNRMAVKIEE